LLDEVLNNLINLWILDRIRENRKNELDHDGRGKEFIKQTSKFDGEGIPMTVILLRIS